MNRGQLKTRVGRMVGISLGTSDDQTDETALLEELANEAVIDVLSRTRVHIRKGTAVMQEGVTDFDVDDQVLRLWGLRRGTANIAPSLLQEQSRESLSSDGVAFPGYSRILIGSPATGGESLTFWYTPRPSPMTDDAHDPAVQAYGRIPVEFHRALLNYMLWHSADKAGDQGTGRGERYRILYEGQDGFGGGGSDLGRIKAAISMRGGASSTQRYREVLVGDLDSSYWMG